MLERLELFPITSEVGTSTGGPGLRIAGCDLEGLANQFGTPLYLYDRATLDRAVKTYKEALAGAYPGASGLTYAGKAFLCTAIAQWTQLQGVWLDCSSAGELHVAAEGNVPREHIVAHGVNKTPADIEAALRLAGTLVIDNLVELNRLIPLYRDGKGPYPQVWIRLRPGMTVATHRHTQTGQSDSKFGLEAEEARGAIQICLENGLPVSGIHFHLGSSFHDPAPLGPAIDTALDLLAEVQQRTGWQAERLCPGGGWGTAYHEAELPHPPIKVYVEFVAGRVRRGCKARGLALPELRLEPGRSLIARAGVAVYRVGAVKRTAKRRWLLLDGGLADNPRPALYASRYSALPARDPGRPDAGPAWLGGPFCESGDVLIEDLPMPEIDEGEIIAVPVSGAYHLSMASNYNGARKPAVVMLEAGRAVLIQRRERVEDLVRRDVRIGD